MEKSVKSAISTAAAMVVAYPTLLRKVWENGQIDRDRQGMNERAHRQHGHAYGLPVEAAEVVAPVMNHEPIRTPMPHHDTVQMPSTVEVRPEPALVGGHKGQPNKNERQK